MTAHITLCGDVSSSKGSATFIYHRTRSLLGGGPGGLILESPLCGYIYATKTLKEKDHGLSCLTLTKCCVCLNITITKLLVNNGLVVTGALAVIEKQMKYIVSHNRHNGRMHFRTH